MLSRLVPSTLTVPRLTSLPVTVRAPPLPAPAWMVPAAALVRVPPPVARVSL